MRRLVAVVAILAVLGVGLLWWSTRVGPSDSEAPVAMPAPTGPAETPAADPADAEPSPTDEDPAAANASDAGTETATSGAGTETATNGAADPAAGTGGPGAEGEAGEDGEDRVGIRELEPLVDERRTSFDAPEHVLQDGLDYRARVETTAGTFVIDLYEDRAPVTVNSFVFLALHRFYDGVPFHRVLEDFMAQTGDPTGTGRGGPGYRFEDEIDPSLSHDAPGVVSMANSGPDTNGSQFFITFTATPWLDGNHAVFGRVIEGMDVLDRLTRIDPSQPLAVASLDDTLASLSQQGVELDGPADATLAERLSDVLGNTPVPGRSFTVGAYRGVIGYVGEEPAVGFFPQPDRIDRVIVLVAEEDP